MDTIASQQLLKQQFLHLTLLENLSLLLSHLLSRLIEHLLHLSQTFLLSVNSLFVFLSNLSLLLSEELLEHGTNLILNALLKFILHRFLDALLEISGI